MIDEFLASTNRNKPKKIIYKQSSKEQELSPQKQSEVFHTPEEIALNSELTASNSDHSLKSPNTIDEIPLPPKKMKLRIFALRWPPKKKEIIVGLLLIAILVSGGGSWLLFHRSTKPVAAAIVRRPVIKKASVPTPTTVASNLSGLAVDPAVNQRPVTGVMIENTDFARPQAGLSQASVVFEAIAEGGITRFLALFQDNQPANVGPIRSARPYFAQWNLTFDAGYAHVGGSPEALNDIRDWHVKNLDQFFNGAYYHRISARFAPHNVYTSIQALNQLETSKGYGPSQFTSWPRKLDSPTKQPTAKTINLFLSGPDFNVSYSYDPTTNSYKRSEGGAPQIDANTNTVINPKVVVALVMPYSLEADGYHSQYGTIGSGPVEIFQDGTVQTGQWAKSDLSSQFVFTDSNGAIIKLNAGQTWLTALGSSRDISSSP